MAKRELSPKSLLNAWIERDLSAAADGGELPRAVDVDDVLYEIGDLLTIGRSPLLMGEPGVGKTAIVHELIRRARDNQGPECIRNRRVLQMSFRRQASSVKGNHEFVSQFQSVVAALAAETDKPLIFLRDIAVADSADMADQLSALSHAVNGLLIGEGTPAAILSMLEDEPSLEREFHVVKIEEPDIDRCARLLEQWRRDQETEQGRLFNDGAIREALSLTQRFLARSRLPRKALDLLHQVSAGVPANREVTASDVVNRFCAVHRTPRVLLDPAVSLDIEALEEHFSSSVLGQEEAVHAVIRMIEIVKAGMSDLRRPFGVFLFVGPTGVGKTHLAQLLAEYLFGGRDRMIRLNMADFPDEADAIRLFGDPSEYRMPLKRGALTARLAGYPFAVLLLDEFEKAHKKVHDRFLQLIDEGKVINGAGESISCQSMIIIATSNAGAKLYRGGALGFGARRAAENLDREVDRILEDHFRIELLNRFDHVVHFRPLSREDIRTIAWRELNQLQFRSGIAQRRLQLEFDEAVLDWLTVHGCDPEYGARLLRRTVERTVAAALADIVVRRNPPENSRISVTIRNRSVCASIVPPDSTIAGSGRESTPATRERMVISQEEILLASSKLREQSSELFSELTRKREERSALIDRMNQSDLWNRREERSVVLERFRQLDVSVRAEERISEPIFDLLDSIDDIQNGRISTEKAARMIELATARLAEWQLRSANEEPGSYWMLISNPDPFRKSDDWVVQVAEMEQRWCRRLHLSASEAGTEHSSEGIHRIVLLVEGPGTAGLLASEVGIHRLRRRQSTDSRARVLLLSRSTTGGASPVKVHEYHGNRSALDLQPTHLARVHSAATGTTHEFVGSDPEILAHWCHDWENLSKTGADASNDLSRLYAADGVGARDPRTGAVSLRLKDVLHGKLDCFLEAWRESTPSQAHPAHSTT